MKGATVSGAVCPRLKASPAVFRPAHDVLNRPAESLVLNFIKAKIAVERPGVSVGAPGDSGGESVVGSSEESRLSDAVHGRSKIWKVRGEIEKVIW